MLVEGSPVTPFRNAIRTALRADVALAGLVTGIYDHLPGASRVPYPYLVLADSDGPLTGGAMGITGGRSTLQLDGWSDAKGPSVMEMVASQVIKVLQHRDVNVTGFALLGGSLTCEMSRVYKEFDADSPEKSTYRMVQRWAAEIHSS